METLEKDTANKLFDHYRKHRDGIRNKPELASICLICGSVHVIPKHSDNQTLFCRSCGFTFQRYDCPSCGKTIDSRDPKNPACRACGLRTCTCGACSCPCGDSA